MILGALLKRVMGKHVVIPFADDNINLLKYRIGMKEIVRFVNDEIRNDARSVDIDD